MSDKFTQTIKNNIWVTFGVISIISLFLLIPTAHIQNLITERHEYGEAVKQEVAGKWSSRQTTGAIVLSVPVVETQSTTDEKGIVTKTEHETSMHFLPNKLHIQSDVKTFERYRGLYKVPLYESKLVFKGDFEKVNPENFSFENKKVLWEKATLSLGVSDVRGIKDVEIKWNKNKVNYDLGSPRSGITDNALIANLDNVEELKNSGSGEFVIELSLRGSEELNFYPFGQVTTVEVNSNWGSPSFSGSFLPESHEIDEKKFNAEWKILGLTRNLPKHFTGHRNISDIMEETQFGVKFHMTLQSYQMNTRSVKYAMLFIFLTFTTMFFVEILYKLRFHPMHYSMIGAGLVLFYLLLLSFTEHIGFAGAYMVASLATEVSITTYVWGVCRIRKSAMIVFGQLGLLYGFLFVLIQEKDYALIFGASGLWLVLSVLMYATRKVNWYELHLGEAQKGAQ